MNTDGFVLKIDGQIAYARGPEHDRFLRKFNGTLRGRYLLAYLVGTEILGGTELRREIERDLNQPRIGPEEMYDARCLVLVCDRGVRAGISMKRVGELVIPAYKRANPAFFQNVPVSKALQLLDEAFQRESTIPGVRSVPLMQPGRAVLHRGDNPAPCEAFVGLVQGLYKALNAQATIEESGCRWLGHPGNCTFDVTWQETAGA